MRDIYWLESLFNSEHLRYLLFKQDRHIRKIDCLLDTKRAKHLLLQIRC